MIVTRERAIPVLANVTVALITGTVRGLPTEVPVGLRQGLRRESVVNCDNILTLPKAALRNRRGQLDPESTRRLDAALRVALGLG